MRLDCERPHDGVVAPFAISQEDPDMLDPRLV